MNKLQDEDLNTTRDYFVSLNPTVEPRDVLASGIDYAHPEFNWKSKCGRGPRLWEIQGGAMSSTRAAISGSGSTMDPVRPCRGRSRGRRETAVVGCQ
jgi:hypothetical protein